MLQVIMYNFALYIIYTIILWKKKRAEPNSTNLFV